MLRHTHPVFMAAVVLALGLDRGIEAAEVGDLATTFRDLWWPPADEPETEATSPADGRTPYVAGMIGSSFAGDASGTAGGTLFTGEGALGVAVPRPLGGVRLEVEGRQRAALSGTRPTPAGGQPSEIGGEWTTMANVWRDLELADHLSIYAGGGLGVGGFAHDADAAGPAAQTRITAFGWQTGGGVAYALTERLTLDVGGRFYGLETGSGDPPAGPPAAELLFAVRIADPLRGWLGR